MLEEERHSDYVCLTTLIINHHSAGRDVFRL